MRRSLASIALAAAMLASQDVLPSNAPRLPAPPIVRDATSRQKRVRERKAAERTRRQLANFAHNDRKRREARARNAEFQAIVNTMTKWERNRWARAGYPGLREKDVQAVYPYAGRAA